MEQSAQQQDGGHRHAAESAVILLAVIAVLAALWVGRELFIPLSIGVVLACLLRPVVERLVRLRVPTPAAAAIVVLLVLGALGGLGASLESPLRSMAAQAPKTIAAARTRLESVTSRLRGMASSGQGAGQSTGAASPRADSTATTRSVSAGPQSSAPQEGGGGPPSGLQGALRSAFGVTASLLSEIVEEVLLAFFLLSAGDAWMRKLSDMSHTRKDAREWPTIAGEMRDVVARYLLVTVLINFTQAIIVGLALWAIGMPTPWLWAALTFVAEFIPYLGGIVMIALLLAAGLAANQGLATALLAPGAYFVVTTLQNNLVSPVAYGKGLRLNPTVILIGVMFWWMVWGVAGAFLAVPILASLRVLGSRVPALAPLAIVLEE